MPDEAYHNQVNKRNQLKLRELLKDLPEFCKEFFIGIEQQTQSRTRIAYAYDLGVFFHFMHENNPACAKIEIKDFPISVLDRISASDIEEYLSYLRYYEKDGKEFTNDERGLVRKLASLKSFYNYFYRRELIEKNTAELVKLPKRHEKNIIRLDVDEIVKFLDQVENGDKLTPKQQAFHEQTKVRDLAMMTLLLGTGIRVSECVGININDIDFENNGVKIFRKGGNESVVYFGPEVEEALHDYYYERQGIMPVEGHENAFFLSLQKKRISVRSVENLVKKYSRTVTSLKNITPHKLRSTYGTQLYRETGDIYLVADVLGHKDVNTTKKHYAALEDERRRRAANAVHLRKDE
ncbi:MAG: tyrosine-type recombinase/integrase [Lachnospiraceae bacterium]|nr:tyrosine-type recombinase/integrase [Lachnospiraceae bacterium]